ncbi:MAG: hypothetical protein JSV42_19250 [Chloroflexota bacterium]|nr:MAG: hypothetical protein JSV42_19250 [Chloroflexota bacterium]
MQVRPHPLSEPTVVPADELGMEFSDLLFLMERQLQEGYLNNPRFRIPISTTGILDLEGGEKSGGFLVPGCKGRQL